MSIIIVVGITSKQVRQTQFSPTAPHCWHGAWEHRPDMGSGWTSVRWGQNGRGSTANNSSESCNNNTTTTILRPVDWDYPGEPVPEETLTHPPTWSSSNLYQLLPSTTIHNILSVQFTCLAIFLHNLSPRPLWSTSWSAALYLIFHKPRLYYTTGCPGKRAAKKLWRGGYYCIIDLFPNFKEINPWYLRRLKQKEKHTQMWRT